ncbi:helix-turn-helix transcriptional regulator [Streptomyces sp. LMG1-1-1.1]|uniref:helix-turn-helix transcriptional regulator n=1 Tax=Streptomyces sp. LMG1-1-1.1 TaxID=3135245 RepID=UPI0034665E72
MSGSTHAAAPGPRLHDRTAELAAVARLSARAATGSPGVLFVTGNPGEGRTTVLAHACHAFPGTGYLVAAPPHRGPWSAARALFAALAPTPAAGRRALRQARGEGGLGRAVAALVAEAEADATALVRAGSDSGADGSGPGSGAGSGSEPDCDAGPAGLASVGRSPAVGSGPVLICVDDLHLWDAHSRAALTATWRENGGREPGPPFRVAWLVSAARHHRLPDVPGAETVRLGRLTPAGARALLRDLCPAGGPSAHVEERVLDESSGHPGVLTAAVRRLTAAQLAGTVPLPLPAVDDDVLSEVYGGLLDRLPSASRRLLTTVAVMALTGRAGVGDAMVGAYGMGVGALPSGARGARTPVEPLEGLVADGLLCRRGGVLGFQDPFLGRAALASARPSRGEAGPIAGTAPAAGGPAADSLSGTTRTAGGPAAGTAGGPTTRTAAGPAAGTAGGPAAGAGVLASGPASGPAPSAVSPTSRRAPGTARPVPHAASSPAPESPHPASGTVPGAALVRGEGHRVDRLGASAAVRALSPLVRGRAQVVRGLAALAGGPVGDAFEALLQAAELLRGRAPVEASDARFLAMEAAWAGGDVAGCLAALDGGEEVRGTERDFADGLSAALSVRLEEGRTALARVVARDGVADDPRLLLRAGSAALVLGDTAAAARVHARALSRARAERRTGLLPRALEQLAYAELRAGRYSRAARTAREGLRAAEATGQHNVAAHQHAVLALVASVAGDGPAVAEHAGRALATAGPHGLVQAATLAEWALARAELGRGLADQATARLVPLVRPGPRGGHFALRMLAVPCFVEAAVAAGRKAEALEAAEEYAAWAALGVDGPAPAQLARCRALLAKGEGPAYWFGEAVRRHDGCGNDFERARTLLAYGTWLRRRRRPGDARGPLRDALVTFERAAAGGWAEHARSELRATGGASGGATAPGGPGELTPQQQRIARLVARGATNQEVADHLSLSPRTVDHHLRGVFARLGIRSRVELPAVVGGWDAEREAGAAGSGGR